MEGKILLQGINNLAKLLQPRMKKIIATILKNIFKLK